MDTDNGDKIPMSPEPVSQETEKMDLVVSEPVKAEKTAKRKFPWFRIFIVIIVAFLVFDIVKKVKLKRNKPEAAAVIVRPVKTKVVKSINGDFEVQYAGTTRAIRQVDIGFNVSGTINELPIKSGITIDKDTVIAELDPRDFQNDLNAALANYTNAQARLARVQKLYDAAVDPKSKLDEAVALFKVAEANLEIAQKARNDTVLKAPFKGIIAIRYVDNYQVVSQGQPIISLQDLETLELQADIPEWLVSRATSAEKIEAFATYESLPGVKIPLKIKEFSAQATSSTRTYVVRFYMETNPTDSSVTILPGMTANITIMIKPTSGNEPTFELPVWAVNSIGGKKNPSVFVVDDTQTPWVVHEKEVAVGQMTQDSIIVKGHLKDGERVVITGAALLQDGMKVRDLPENLRSNVAENADKNTDGNNVENSAQMLPEVTK